MFAKTIPICFLVQWNITGNLLLPSWLDVKLNVNCTMVADTRQDFGSVDLTRSVGYNQIKCISATSWLLNDLRKSIVSKNVSKYIMQVHIRSLRFQRLVLPVPARKVKITTDQENAVGFPRNLTYCSIKGFKIYNIANIRTIDSTNEQCFATRDIKFHPYWLCIFTLQRLLPCADEVTIYSNNNSSSMSCSVSPMYCKLRVKEFWVRHTTIKPRLSCNDDVWLGAINKIVERTCTWCRCSEYKHLPGVPLFMWITRLPAHTITKVQYSWLNR